jgi:very-short-patch-repair endonuclease
MSKSDLEIEFLYHIQDLELGELIREYRFNPDRRWRSDFCYPDFKLLVEIEGGTWIRGAHTRAARYSKDCEKYNWAAIHGWKVLRFTSDMVKSGRCRETMIYFLQYQEDKKQP